MGAAPAGARFQFAPIPSGILLATPFTLAENLALAGIEIATFAIVEQQGLLKVAIYAAVNGLPSGAALVATDIVVKPNSRAIWQAPADSPVVIEAGNYFAVTMSSGALTLRAIDGDSQEIESILGRSATSDQRPVSALVLPAAAVTSLPLIFAGTEAWQDWHASVGAPVVYLAS
ncbi:MAG: hypothetical protein WDN02_05190 [Methylovirgula sp.]|uniref:hypothetical protein n=1 Tax=Methylovirgula sp. TaxID=1978224 RepID=UPI00307638DA